ncbi:restriction endonuclease [Burkholderia pseudomallei]|uniref:restriction endonuclease n=1 Tax=Burkholderia pseudomallei TaxID=28450 RepID=UPI000E6A25FE|nr:restriction endonuclease [Burkholderia pseudomallei]RIV65972.1 hypothetical protein D2W72_22195 [Burkholderia pseudomallei]RIV78579.1 hypothetical protein D2V84_15625 [Burkholderia pseudomallei]
MQLRVEVAVDDKTSTTAQGQLLEALGQEILETQNHEVTSQVRLTGVEVDLLAKHKNSGDVVFVECKAYTDKNISADVLTKLLGTVELHGVQSGWLLTTTELGKDAKGIVDAWQKRPAHERRRLQVYRTDQIAELLIKNGRCTDPALISRSSAFRWSEDATLLITNVGRFWAIPILHATAGIAQKVGYFDAADGKPIEENLVASLSRVKSTFAELEVARDVSTSPLPKIMIGTDPIKEEFDNIVAVPIADNWSDYRPARPDDFVGREGAQGEAMDFFENVRRSSTALRLLAIKAPSGWGKSSFLNKLRSRCRSKHNANKYYVYAVDCRTAISGRYAELALKKALDSAASDGFLEIDPVTIGSSAHPFSDASAITALEKLKSEQKVLVLFFDQFEEITTKVELEGLFQSIQNLCYAIDGLSENVILGFSWKTDGTVPQDHPAYHTWHNLADRRYEIELPPFSPAEVSSALTKFSKELGQPINAQLKRMLADHCQGYPWLLKKLCIHIFNSISKGKSQQAEFLSKALNVEELFRRDLSDLSGSETECLRRIASDSPAEFFQIEAVFGGDVVKRLIDKRLVIRNASKLILYWDIFRDYVLTERVPFIPIRYIPRTHISTYMVALAALLEKRKLTLSALERRLKVSAGTADNIARDLVMVGNAERLRKEGRIELIQHNEVDACATIYRFLLNHEVVRKLIHDKGVAFKVGHEEIAEVMKDVFVNAEFASKTWLVYAKVFVNWLEAFKIVRVSGDEIEHTPEGVAPKKMADIVIGRGRSRLATFSGEAPPQRVLELLDRLLRGEAPIPSDRNALYVLRSLNLIAATTQPVLLDAPPPFAVERWLALRVVKQPLITDTWRDINRKPDISPLELGEKLAVSRNKNWSEGSKQRYGFSILAWHKWVAQILV